VPGLEIAVPGLAVMVPGLRIVVSVCMSSKVKGSNLKCRKLSNMV